MPERSAVMPLKYCIRLKREKDIEPEWKTFNKVVQEIKKIDPRAVVDSQRNPVTMWVTTTIPIQDIFIMKFVDDVIVAN